MYYNEYLLTHLLLVVFSALFFASIQYLSKVLSPIVCPRFFLPRPASKKPWLDSPKIRALDWDLHVVSLVHSVMVAVAATWFFFSRSDDLRAVFDDRIFGYSFSVGVLMSFSCGYFLWDTYWSLCYIRVFGKGFALHAIVCFINYLLSLTPLIMYYGIVFLLWEWSTPFVNIHWFISRLTEKENRIRLFSGISVIVSFVAVRIVFGFYYSFQLQRDFILNFHKFPIVLLMFYTLSNIAINSLNMFWLGKMLTKAFSRARKEN